MSREDLLMLLDRASKLLHEDESLIRETQNVLNKMTETENGVISISQKSYKRLSQDDYYEKNPFTFEETEPPEHSQPLGKTGLVILVIGIIFGLFRLIAGPIMFFRSKSLIKADPWADMNHNGYNFIEKIFSKDMKTYAHGSFIGMLLSTIVIVAGIVIITGLICFILYTIQSRVNEKNYIRDKQMLAPANAERRRREEREHYERFLAAQRDYDQKIANAIQNDKNQIQRQLQSLADYKEICIRNHKRHNDIWTEFDRDISPYYPPDYAYPEAADAFYWYVKNLAASTMQDAVNRYLDDRQHEMTRDLIRQQIQEGRANADRTIQAINASSNKLKMIISDTSGRVAQAVNEQTRVLDVRSQLLSDQVMLLQFQQVMNQIDEAQRHFESMRQIDRIGYGLSTGRYV